MKKQQIYTDKPLTNIFEKYFNEALKEKKPKLIVTGPYISISRDFGCQANSIAQRLSKELTRRCMEFGKGKDWKWINKSILEESSKALKLSPSKIEYVFKSKDKTMMDDIVSAMATRYYKSDKKIRNTIIEVIRSITKTGHVIIVGRGGVAFAKDNPLSFHIKLTAPLEWRIDRISETYNKTRESAKKYILEIDKERKFLIDNFIGHKTDHSIFDVVFNRKTITEGEIVNSIISLMKMKNMII